MDWSTSLSLDHNFTTSKFIITQMSIMAIIKAISLITSFIINYTVDLRLEVAAMVRHISIARRVGATILSN
jgi:hypothetical protein